MNVSELMIEDVACCALGDTDNRAAQLMWEHDCGVVPIVDQNGRAVGMVTDRDLCMAAYTSGRPLTELTVDQAMSRDLVGCCATDSVENALDVMRRNRVHRLPVLDDDRHVVGVLSMTDVVRSVDGPLEKRERRPLLEATIGALGGVCRPRAHTDAEASCPLPTTERPKQVERRR